MLLDVRSSVRSDLLQHRFSLKDIQSHKLFSLLFTRFLEFKTFMYWSLKLNLDCDDFAGRRWRTFVLNRIDLLFLFLPC
jgi:hypothetical protein